MSSKKVALLSERIMGQPMSTQGHQLCQLGHLTAQEQLGLPALLATLVRLAQLGIPDIQALLNGLFGFHAKYFHMRMEVRLNYEEYNNHN
jgi:hypothetical protein